MDQFGGGAVVHIDDEGIVNRVVECDGTCDALRFMEFDSRMITDHCNYYGPLRAIRELSKTAYK